MIGLNPFLDSLWNFSFKNGGLHPGGDIQWFPGPQDIVYYMMFGKNALHINKFEFWIVNIFDRNWPTMYHKNLLFDMDFTAKHVNSESVHRISKKYKCLPFLPFWEGTAIKLYISIILFILCICMYYNPRTATDMDGTLPHWSLKSETSRDIKKSFEHL